MVLRADPAARRVIISHRDIPGFMRAMAMEFEVRDPRELEGLAPGAQIDFELVAGKGGSYIRGVRRREVTADGVPDSDGRRFRLQTPAESVAVGAAPPDFALIDQNARPVRLSDFRGKVVAVNFIYTRCPLPDVCPRLSANFARLQGRFAARIPKDLVLLSITIDPEHDTPEELRRYATIWKARPEGWRFLTGSYDDIRAVAARFGMNYWAEEGLITHTSRTAIVSRGGRLAGVVEGSRFMLPQLGDLIEKELEP
jgi:protein SCO1/2